MNKVKEQISYTHSPAYKRAQIKYRLNNVEKLKKSQKSYYIKNKAFVNARNTRNYKKRKAVLKAKKEKKEAEERIISVTTATADIKATIRELHEKPDLMDSTDSMQKLYDSLKIILRN